jgi:hypothetical protein
MNRHLNKNSRNAKQVMLRGGDEWEGMSGRG